MDTTTWLTVNVVSVLIKSLRNSLDLYWILWLSHRAWASSNNTLSCLLWSQIGVARVLVEIATPPPTPLLNPNPSSTSLPSYDSRDTSCSLQCLVLLCTLFPPPSLLRSSLPFWSNQISRLYTTIWWTRYFTFALLTVTHRHLNAPH